MVEPEVNPQIAIGDFIVFRPDTVHRRKSSLVATDDPRNRRSGSDAHDKNTACFVHSLLSGDWAVPYEYQEDDKAVADENINRKPIEIEPGSNDNESREYDRVGVVDYASRLPDQSAPTVVHSRHLTKGQLSDMAWNVRKLSKRLGSVKLKLKVKAVVVVTKACDESLIKLTRDLTKWLLSKDRDTLYTVYVQESFQNHPNFDGARLVDEVDEPSARDRLRYWNGHIATDHPQTFDFVITLGGDGTVLYTSWLFQRIVPPVLSFSLGSLGFLTKFDFSNYQDTITKSFRDGVAISLRLRFECTVMRSNPRRLPAVDEEGNIVKKDLVDELVGEEIGDTLTHVPDKEFQILNDIVVDRGPNPTMSTIELFGDDEHFTTVLADGVCVSTPTGSTAYNLAAGGALSHPENPVILVTAICAHTLSFRPIILPDTIVLRMGVPYDARTTSWASFDGRERIELHPGDYVTVSASRYPFANVMPAGRRSEDWVQSISKTLNWNSRQRQKTFTK
uniref:Putative kinase C3H5.11 n=1 Tax=Talaromyces marneffei PM1 TaxID=1077442 RepID=A0A093VX80_TALMA